MDPKAVIIGFAVVYLSAIYLSRRRNRRAIAKTAAGVPSVPLRLVEGATVQFSPFLYVPPEDALVSTICGTEAFLSIRDAQGPNGATTTADVRWGASEVVSISPPKGLFTTSAQTAEASMVMGASEGRLYEVIVSEPSLSPEMRLDMALRIAGQVESVAIPRPSWGTMAIAHGGKSTPLPDGAVGFRWQGSSLLVALANGALEAVPLSELADATITYRDQGISLPLVPQARVYRSSLAPCYSVRVSWDGIEGTIEHWTQLPSTWRRHPPTTDTLQVNVLLHMTNQRSALSVCDVGGQQSIVWDETSDDATCRSYVCQAVAADSIWVLRWVASASDWDSKSRSVVWVMDGLSLPLR